MFDWIIKGGLLVDGSGAPPRQADIAISGGSIAQIAPVIGGSAANTLQLKGQLVCPGFVDIHRHADAALFRPGFGQQELRQGITTIVNGNCGLSIAPCPAAHRQTILSYLRPITGSLPPDINFESYPQYVDAVKQQSLPLNVGMLVGSGTLRMAAAGFGAAPLSAAGLAALHTRLGAALSSGALGVSLGLAYVPDSYYTKEELMRALAPMAGGMLPLVTHVRGEGDLLFEGVKEVLQVAKQLEVPLHISHYKCIGKSNWGHLLAKTTALIDTARAQGMEVHCDVYPWTAGSTQLVSLLPPRFLEGGPAQTARLLQNPAQRRACREMLERPGANFENIIYAVGWDAILISGVHTRQNQKYVGATVAEMAAAQGKNPYDAAFDLLCEEGCDVAMVDFITCEEDIESILRLPYSSIISDAIYPDTGLIHPRSWANVPHVLNYFVKKRGSLTLAQAVHKMSGAPAAALNLRGKGLVKEGYDADLVVINRDTFHSAASYTNPAQPPQGVTGVWVNGQLAVKNDSLTGVSAGRFIAR